MTELEDKEFSFCLRDKLAKYCDDNDIFLSLQDPRNEKMLLDMIVYCSVGGRGAGAGEREGDQILSLGPHGTSLHLGKLVMEVG